MSTNLYIINSNPTQVEPSFPQVGINQVLEKVGDGIYRQATSATTHCVMTGNLAPIWREIGWHPNDWFDRVGDKVEVTADVQMLLWGVVQRLKDLPNPLHDRLNPPHPDGGVWGATPNNALVIITWMLAWTYHPETEYIERGSH